jgi:hypothetical protein
MTTLLPGQVLGFPLVRGGGWGRGTPEALQEGRATPAGVTTSVPDKPTGISPDPQKTTTPSDRRAPPNLPPTCLRHHDLGNHPRRLTAVTNTRPRVRGWDNGNRGSHNAAVREGTASTARHRGSRPDVTTETHQAQTGPARPTSL